MSNEELKAKAIEYLKENTEAPIRPDELTIYDILNEIPGITKRNALIRMDKLIESGKWDWRFAYVPEHRRSMKVIRYKG